MKKTAALFIALFSLVWLTGAGWLPLAMAPAIDPLTTAWVAQVVTNGGTVSAGRQTIVNTFIVCLKANSLFTTLDRYWLLAGENTPSALTDMVGLTLAANSGATFAASVGYTGNGNSGFVNSNYNPSTQGVNFTLNSASFGGQIQNNRVTNSNILDFGDGDSAFTNVTSLGPKNVAGNSSLQFNATSGTAVATSATSQGSWVATRTSSTGGALYYNGSISAPGGAYTKTSSAVPNANFFMVGASQGASNIGASTDQESTFFAGAGWNATQAANFETCQNAMLTSIGINVH